MNRQEQVEFIMKNTLKTYFKKKEITKEEYKYILKKAVPQVNNIPYCPFHVILQIVLIFGLRLFLHWP